MTTISPILGDPSSSKQPSQYLPNDVSKVERDYFVLCTYSWASHVPIQGYFHHSILEPGVIDSTAPQRS